MNIKLFIFLFDDDRKLYIYYNGKIQNVQNLIVKIKKLINDKKYKCVLFFIIKFRLSK